MGERSSAVPESRGVAEGWYFRCEIKHPVYPGLILIVVADDEKRLIRVPLLKSGDDPSSIFFVQTCGWFVHDEQRPVCQQRSGKRKSPTLSAGKALPMFADLSIQGVARSAQVREQSKFRQDREHLSIRGMDVAVGESLADRPCQQRCILFCDCHVSPRFVRWHAQQVVPVEYDPSCLGLEESTDDVDECCLAAARRSPDQE